jgi:hypothetical protein
LFLWLIIVYITTAVYLLLSKKQASTFPNRFTGCHNTYNIKDMTVDEPYFRGFTSTSMGSSESFLPHFGHFPSYCWRTSSGGFRSGPSYNMWLHPLQITRCGTAFSLSEITKVTSATYLLVTSAQLKQKPVLQPMCLSWSSLPFLNHSNSNSAGYNGC